MTDHILGVDISKANLDVHLIPTGETQQFANSTAGFRRLIAWLRERPVSRVVYEPTGPCALPPPGLRRGRPGWRHRSSAETPRRRNPRTAALPPGRNLPLSCRRALLVLCPHLVALQFAHCLVPLGENQKMPENNTAHLRQADAHLLGKVHQVCMLAFRHRNRQLPRILRHLFSPPNKVHKYLSPVRRPPCRPLNIFIFKVLRHCRPCRPLPTRPTWHARTRPP